MRGKRDLKKKHPTPQIIGSTLENLGLGKDKGERWVSSLVPALPGGCCWEHQVGSIVDHLDSAGEVFLQSAMSSVGTGLSGGVVSVSPSLG